MATQRVQSYVLTFTGAAQRLSDAYTVTTVGGSDDVPIENLILQPDGANAAACFFGSSSAVSASVYGFSLAAGNAGVPPLPFILGLPVARIRLSDLWVLGTSTQKLHIMLVSY
ncbi:MAG TPA: hypothetical protein VFO16_24165 [Pseudonocardiaceae bacterium]|nr:hypothetical protein [Pseudonocardiaceae bacterium]